MYILYLAPFAYRYHPLDRSGHIKMNIENDAKKVPHRASLKVEEEVRVMQVGVRLNSAK